MPTRAFSHSTWRSALATSVASAALFAYGVRPVRAQAVTPPAPPCNQISGITGSIITCSGDLSGGVNLPNAAGPFEVLNVNNLTTNIMPASGYDGIRFTSDGAVTINSDTGPFAITASGTIPYGIYAQSTGAGAVTVRSTGDVTSTGGSAIGAVASGAGAVSVTSVGDLNAGRYGIFAQSGSGSVTVESTGDITSTDGAAIRAFSYGSAAVSVTSVGNLSASGSGIIVQSNSDVTVIQDGLIASAAAGINVVSISGSVEIFLSGTIVTTGSFADGVFAVSNGGPITITSTADIITSGSGAGAGIRAGVFSAPLTIISSGNIATSGNGAFGIYAESNTNDDITIVSSGDIATTGAAGVGIFAETSGAIMLYSHGRVTTLGDGAAGIAAAGEGGTAVVSTGDITTYGDNAPGFTVISDGNVAVASSGNITTTGMLSYGIDVESSGGSASILNAANITTTGPASDAIAAVAFGTVEIVNTGNLLASGTGSTGIYAAGQAGNLVVNFGVIEGCPCAGVVLFSAGSNQLTNFGSIISDPTGNAIELMGADNQIDNYGFVAGRVMFSGPGAFNNRAGALFNSGDIVIADVNNSGRLAPGGQGVIEITTLTGNITQNAGGIFAVDVDAAANTSDQIVDADTAALAGKVAVSMLSIPLTAAQTFTILSTTGGAVDNGLGLIASPALHATLSFQNGTDVVLGISVDFGVDGLNLNPNQKAIGENLDKIFRAGAGGVGPVLLGLLNVDSIDAFKAALNQLSPELYSDAQIGALYANLAFSGSLLSCKVNGTDTASIIREGQCLWAGASAVFLDAGTTSDQIGFTETAGLFTAGAQVALDDVWRLGAAAGYQNSTLQTATGAQSEGSLGQGGVALKYNPGPLLLAGTVSGGGAQYDTRRVMSFGGFTGVAEGDQKLGFVNGGLRVAYVLGSPHLYWKPMIDLNLTRLQLGSFTESGGNGAGLAVQSGGQTVFTLAPMLEAGTEWWLANGTLVRPLLRAGGIWYSNDDLALTASFESAPTGVGPFTINTKFDQVMGLIGAGLDVINGGDAAMRLSYDAQLGETTQIHSVGIKGSAKF